jgi:hypothetical protein
MAFGEQPQGDVTADPVAALNRPDPILDDRLQVVDVTHHRGEPGLIGAEPTTAQDRLVGGHHLDRDRPLVRVHSDHDPFCLLLHALSRCSIPVGPRVGKGNATSSWADPS